MEIINLKIHRIMIHQIFQRDEEGNKVKPTQSYDFVEFDDDALITFKSRFINAIGSDSKAVQMDILNQDKTDLPIIIEQISTADEDDYKSLSYDIANKLADAQVRRNLSGGIVVVFKGTYGATPKKFVAIMKAEIHSAYEKLIDPITKKITLKYVEEALLTPATRLYKTAGFFHTGFSGETDDLNDKWDVFISDSQINQTDGKASAHYFYSIFAGCGYPETSARTTKQFYDATCEFFDNLDISPVEKNDLRNTLVSYLKTEKSSVVNPTEFASRLFDVETCDSYSEFLEEKNLPTNAFTKDTQHIKTKLSTRKLSFGNSIKITAPSEAFEDVIDIEKIEENSDGEPVNWTKVIIKGEIVSQE